MKPRRRAWTAQFQAWPVQLYVQVPVEKPFLALLLAQERPRVRHRHRHVFKDCSSGGGRGDQGIRGCTTTGIRVELRARAVALHNPHIPPFSKPP